MGMMPRYKGFDDENGLVTLKWKLPASASARKVLIIS